MPTMRDVAEKAGVSITTVSHVINETRVVSDDLRAVVMAAIETLGYQPNVLARGLRRGETTTIGMIVPDNANPFFAEVARGVEDTSFENGFNVILCNSDGNLEKEEKYTRLLLEKRVDGILFVAAGISTEQIQRVQAQEIPLVVVDREIPDVEVDMVQTDHQQGGFLAAQYLLELGHHQIGCIRGPSVLNPSAARVKGYQIALEQAGIPVDESYIERGDFQFESGFNAAMKLLKRPNRPTAIFVCNDLMAVGAISAAVELGLSVPADLSIVGFDNVSLARYSNPPLTTINQPSHEMGIIATKMLLERINNPSHPVQCKMVETRLVKRHSATSYRQ